jgi:molybdopterin synthase sulfur carrier subunit
MDGSSKRATAEGAAMVVLRLPAVLVDLFPGSTRRVEVQASTVREAIDEANKRWPGMRDRICDSRPAIRKHMNVFVDGERVKLNAPLAPGAEVFILTAISGG